MSKPCFLTLVVSMLCLMLPNNPLLQPTMFTLSCQLHQLLLQRGMRACVLVTFLPLCLLINSVPLTWRWTEHSVPPSLAVSCHFSVVCWSLPSSRRNALPQTHAPLSIPLSQLPSLYIPEQRKLTSPATRVSPTHRHIIKISNQGKEDVGKSYNGLHLVASRSNFTMFVESGKQNSSKLVSYYENMSRRMSGH